MSPKLSWIIYVAWRIRTCRTENQSFVHHNSIKKYKIHNYTFLLFKCIVWMCAMRIYARTKNAIALCNSVAMAQLFDFVNVSCLTSFFFSFSMHCILNVLYFCVTCPFCSFVNSNISFIIIFLHSHSHSHTVRYSSFSGSVFVFLLGWWRTNPSVSFRMYHEHRFRLDTLCAYVFMLISIRRTNNAK